MAVVLEPLYGYDGNMVMPVSEASRVSNSQLDELRFASPQKMWAADTEFDENDNRPSVWEASHLSLLPVRPLTASDHELFRDLGLGLRPQAELNAILAPYREIAHRPPPTEDEQRLLRTVAHGLQNQEVYEIIKEAYNKALVAMYSDVWTAVVEE